MRKLTLSLLLLSFASYADVKVLDNGDLRTSACAYGRGQSAITQASNNAAAELGRFIKGNKVLDFGDDSESFESSLSQVYSSSRVNILEGLSAGRMQLDLGQPYLQGSDTCVDVTINIRQTPKGNSDDELLEWNDDDPTVTVTVVGEGWSTAGDSARQRAETDALRRAISRVVGIYLSQNSVQSSQTVMQISNDDEHNSMRDLMSQQMSNRSSGLVKSWQPLASKKLAKDGLQVTLQVIVEKAPLIAQTNDLLEQIGSPTVKVIANKAYEPRLKGWLAQQGINIGQGASLMIEANHELIGGQHNKRLALEISVSDLAGNVYGHWRNDSSLVALPDSHRVLDDLLQVTFRMPGQLASLQKALRSAFINVVEQGGLVRNIKIKRNHLQQPEKLYGVLSTIGGAKDVSLYQHKGFIIANLRYAGPTGELAAILQNSLQIISSKSLSRAQVLDEQTILFN